MKKTGCIFRSRRLINAFLSAFMAIIFVSAGIFAPLSSFTVSSLAESICEAGYPESISMPDQSAFINANGDFDYDAYSASYDAWAENYTRNRLPDKMADGLNDFFFVSARELLSGGDQKNKVYSPVNVYLALAMLSEITGGQTQNEILALLNAESAESLRRQANAVFASVYQNDGETTCIPASSIWLRNDLPYKEETLEILKDAHYASSFSGEMGAPEYDALIQKWLSEQTGGLLDKQAKNIKFDPDTIIALATSLYFKAGWTNEFSKANTKENVFYAPQRDMTAEFMNKNSHGTYYRGDTFGAVALGMTNHGSMWIVLPDEGISAESLFENEDVFALTKNPSLWPDQKNLIIRLSIPKFDVTGENKLIGSLKKLGLQAVFDENLSDFTPLTDKVQNIAVTSAQHDARVKTDETGVEAAAYTVIMADATSARPPEETMDFVADRPFAFIITSADNLPLFAGIVNETGK